MNICEYLKQRNVPFHHIHHSATMDASRLAQELGVPGKQVAKTVLLRSDDGYVIAVVPSTRHVDCDAMRALLGARRIQLATESEAGELFPDVEYGVVPPFGSQYGVRTVLDVHLAACESIVFKGATHEEAVRMQFRDYELLEGPLTAMISKPGVAPQRVRIAY